MSKKVGGRTPHGDSFWCGRSVLVAGGCGFIGSYLVEELVAAGAQVIVMDNLATGARENIAAVWDQVEFAASDALDPVACRKVCNGVDVVMNLVGRAFGLEYSMHHHGEMLYHNAVAQLNLLEAARQAGVRSYLAVSSSCIYPDDAPVPTSELSVTCGLPEQVNEGYAWSKRIAELQAGYYARETDMAVKICRPFNPYGGRYRWLGGKSHVLPTLMKKVLDGENPVVVWGSGNQRRNFLHVRDTARLMMLVLEHAESGQPVNIGYDDDIALADLARLICRMAGRSPRIVFDASKPEGRFRKCADATRLRTVSKGYQPRISLEEGIVEMIDWYHRNFSSEKTVTVTA